MIGEKAIGGDRATVKIRGQKSPMCSLIIPQALVKEVTLKDRDIVRIWIEKTGLKAEPRKNAFGKYNLEQPQP